MVLDTGLLVLEANGFSLIKNSKLMGPLPFAKFPCLLSVHKRLGCLESCVPCVKLRLE